MGPALPHRRVARAARGVARRRPDALVDPRAAVRPAEHRRPHRLAHQRRQPARDRSRRVLPRRPPLAGRRGARAARAARRRAGRPRGTAGGARSRRRACCCSAFGLLSAVLLTALRPGVGGLVRLRADPGVRRARVRRDRRRRPRSSRAPRAAPTGSPGSRSAPRSSSRRRATRSEGGSPLPWLTPFGWTQQTRAYADERWWLLARLGRGRRRARGLSPCTSRARRDLGDGLLAHRRGRTHAASWISGPVALAWRLDRTLSCSCGRWLRGARRLRGLDAHDVGRPRARQPRPRAT